MEDRREPMWSEYREQGKSAAPEEGGLCWVLHAQWNQHTVNELSTSPLSYSEVKGDQLATLSCKPQRAQPIRVLWLQYNKKPEADHLSSVMNTVLNSQYPWKDLRGLQMNQGP